MKGKSLNHSLRAAKEAKQDEFYTQLSDIEKELRHYTKHFKGKIVLCNCDDPKVSNFFHYFSHNFEKLKLNKLITTCYKNGDADLFSRNTAEAGIYLEYDGDKNNNRVPDPEEIGIHKLNGDGDFRSEECIRLLKEADIVVTNPPFSLFREYVEQLVKYKKKFLIIGHMNALHYKEVFKLIKEDKLWLGESIHSGDREFGVPDHYPLEAAGFRIDEKGRKYIRVKGVRWFTNMDNPNRHEQLPLYKKYSAVEYLNGTGLAQLAVRLGLGQQDILAAEEEARQRETQMRAPSTTSLPAATAPPDPNPTDPAPTAATQSPTLDDPS